MGQGLTLEELEEKDGEAIDGIDWLPLRILHIPNGKKGSEHVWQCIYKVQALLCHSCLLDPLHLRGSLSRLIFARQQNRSRPTQPRSSLAVRSTMRDRPQSRPGGRGEAARRTAAGRVEWASAGLSAALREGVRRRPEGCVRGSARSVWKPQHG